MSGSEFYSWCVGGDTADDERIGTEIRLRDALAVQKLGTARAPDVDKERRRDYWRFFKILKYDEYI